MRSPCEDVVDSWQVGAARKYSAATVARQQQSLGERKDRNGLWQRIRVAIGQVQAHMQILKPCQAPGVSRKIAAIDRRTAALYYDLAQKTTLASKRATSGQFRAKLTLRRPADDFCAGRRRKTRARQENSRPSRRNRTVESRLRAAIAARVGHAPRLEKICSNCLRAASSVELRSRRIISSRAAAASFAAVMGVEPDRIIKRA